MSGETRRAFRFRIELLFTILLAIIFLALLSRLLHSNSNSTPSPLASASATTAVSTPSVQGPYALHPREALFSFIPLRRDPFSVSEKVKGILGRSPVSTHHKATPRKLTLNATVIDGTERYAIINGMLYVQGQEINGLKITQIGEKSVILSNGEQTIQLDLDHEGKS
jgi:hypothetical protein